MLRAILLLLLLLILIGGLLPRLLRVFHGTRRGGSERKVAQMVRCVHCAMFVPAADAVYEGDQPYCSDIHRRLGPARQS
ncbi:MAG: hypothetical protein HYR49_03255 [Gammaproteobacteria bacterium]|nr:hypothetical protein [Gammaproteobacteria bacterium]